MSNFKQFAVHLLLLVLLTTFIATSDAGTAALHCIDSDADVQANPQVSYCPNHWKKCCDDDSCVPDRLRSPNGESTTGFIVFRDTPNTNQGKQLTWVKPTGSGSVSEYVYMRYYVSREPNSNSVARLLQTLCPSCGNLNAAKDTTWKEGCFQMDFSKPERFIILDSDYFYSEYLVVDKIIVLALDNGQTIPCTSTIVDPIKSYCKQGPPSQVSEFVDTEVELYQNKWNVSSSLKYARRTSELPQSVSQRLPHAEGLFYFHGRPRGAATVQEITRPKTSKANEAHLHIRYYIHQSNPNNAQRFYVLPVTGQVLGVQYLQPSNDFEWKEEFLHLEDDGTNFSFRIGTTNGVGDDDLFIIDKMIYTQR